MKNIELDKRRIERFNLTLSVRIKSGGVETADLFTRDISSKGAFVRTSKPLPSGAKVELFVTLPAGKFFLNVTGKVVRVEQDGMGIQFIRPGIVPLSNVNH